MTQMNNDIQRMGFWKHYSVYFAGAGLTYIWAFGVNFIGGDSNLEARVVWALVFGTFIWPFFLVPQILIQWLLRKLMGHRLDGSFSKQLLVLNFPIVILVAALLGYQCINASPRSSFEHLIAKPIPASVRSIEQGNYRAMDSVYRVLHFEISRPDLEKLLDSQHFVPLAEAWDFKRSEQRIRTYTKLQVTFTADWRAYIRKETGGEKYIYFNPNSTEVVFVADAH
jgi:hypothetical protein